MCVEEIMENYVSCQKFCGRNFGSVHLHGKRLLDTWITGLIARKKLFRQKHRKMTVHLSEWGVIHNIPCDIFTRLIVVFWFCNQRVKIMVAFDRKWRKKWNQEVAMIRETGCERLMLFKWWKGHNSLMWGKREVIFVFFVTMERIRLRKWIILRLSFDKLKYDKCKGWVWFGRN